MNISVRCRHRSCPEDLISHVPKVHLEASPHAFVWPGSKISYCFDAQISKQAKTAFLSAVEHVKLSRAGACLQFKKVDCGAAKKTANVPSSFFVWARQLTNFLAKSDFSSATTTTAPSAAQVESTTTTTGRPQQHLPAPHILVSSAKPGCFGNLGLVQHPGNGINLGAGCEFRAVALKLLMHALGFGHEHQRPDRNSHIVIDKESSDKTMFNELENFAIEKRQSTTFAYDYASITHAGPHEFARSSLPKTENSRGAAQKGKKATSSGGGTTSDEKPALVSLPRALRDGPARTYAPDHRAVLGAVAVSTSVSTFEHEDLPAAARASASPAVEKIFHGTTFRAKTGKKDAALLGQGMGLSAGDEQKLAAVYCPAGGLGAAEKSVLSERHQAFLVWGGIAGVGVAMLACSVWQWTRVG